MSTSISSDFSNLLTMNTTVSLVKTTSQAMIDADKKANSSTDKTDSTDKKSDYNEAMDYNGDGSVAINEKLRYYAEQTAEQIKNSSYKKSTGLTKADYASAGMSGYYDAQSNLQMSKAISAYSYKNAVGKTNTFTINVK